MPIHIPGIPRMYRRRKIRATGSRDATASLSLIPMIDMFSVLAIFLLQSYSSTGKPIELPQKLSLPTSQHTREANPAHVVSISRDKVYLDGEPLVDTAVLRESSEWLVPDLYARAKKVLAQDEVLLKQKKLEPAKIITDSSNPVDYHKRYTIQADKDVNFFTIKKALYTLTEAGVEEINFTVLYSPKPVQ